MHKTTPSHTTTLTIKGGGESSVKAGTGQGRRMAAAVNSSRTEATMGKTKTEEGRRNQSNGSGRGCVAAKLH